MSLVNSVLIFLISIASLSGSILYTISDRPSPVNLPKPKVLSATSAPTPSYSPFPIPTQIPVYKPVVNADPDPPVHCKKSPECGGGTIPLKQSECAITVCCGVGGNWVFYRDKNKCLQDQANENSSNLDRQKEVSDYIEWRKTHPMTVPTIKTYSVDNSGLNNAVNDSKNYQTGTIEPYNPSINVDSGPNDQPTSNPNCVHEGTYVPPGTTIINPLPICN